MRFEDEQSLLRHIKEEPCLPVYLLYGQQSYLVRLYAKKLREKALSPASTDWNFTRLDRKSTRLNSSHE